MAAASPGQSETGSKELLPGQPCGYAEAQALDPTHTAFKDYMHELDWDWAERQIAHTTSIVRIP